MTLIIILTVIILLSFINMLFIMGWEMFEDTEVGKLFIKWLKNKLEEKRIMDDYILQKEYVAAEYSYDNWYPAHYVTKKGEEVVRCHNCQRFKPFPIEQTEGHCRWLKVPVSYMDFCSHAIKKKVDL